MLESAEFFTDKKLGLNYTKEKTTIRVWAPVQEQITLCVYNSYNTLSRKEYIMRKDEDGCFEFNLDGDYEGKFYTFLIDDMEIIDPYSFASSANSKRSAIIDLSKSNPEGFEDHVIPFNDKNKAIICEAHIADISIDETSGAENRGLFLGSSQIGTKYNDLPTTIDHFKDLGITHLHLLPVTDYLTVDETKPLSQYPNNYNWGYDQELYNNIEGSFSTNSNDPYSRIREFKTFVKNYHEKGISIVLDVVYNHTFRTNDSSFNVLYPGYYYRRDSNGFFSNGSGCGNELASERKMVSKFIIDSLCFLAREYKIDGFRFDLMALIDIDTIMEAIEELKKINPNILIYGEPWMALASPLAYDKQITIGAQKGNEFSIFNPFFRDNIKGDNDGESRGYLQGEYYLKPSIEEGLSGSVGLVVKGSPFETPLESINYFNAHDNLIFNDKLVKSRVQSEELADLTYMGFSLIMTSQGLPFFHAGNEFMRTKKMNHNSYNASSDINGIDWSLKEKNLELYEKVKRLIEMRKTLGLFNFSTAKEVYENLAFIKTQKDFIIAFSIKKDDKTYIIVHNLSKNVVNLDLPNYTKLTKIWEDGFVSEDLEQVVIGKYSTQIYEVKGE